MKPISVQSGTDCLSDELLSKAIHTCHVLDIFIYFFLNAAFVACSRCHNVTILCPCHWVWRAVCLITPEVIHSIALAFVFIQNVVACLAHGHDRCSSLPLWEAGQKENFQPRFLRWESSEGEEQEETSTEKINCLGPLFPTWPQEHDCCFLS